LWRVRVSEVALLLSMFRRCCFSARRSNGEPSRPSGVLAYLIELIKVNLMSWLFPLSSATSRWIKQTERDGGGLTAEFGMTWGQVHEKLVLPLVPSIRLKTLVTIFILKLEPLMRSTEKFFHLLEVSSVQERVQFCPSLKTCLGPGAVGVTANKTNDVIHFCWQKNNQLVSYIFLKFFF
jgi:hypothetical protein